MSISCFLRILKWICHFIILFRNVSIFPTTSTSSHLLSIALLSWSWRHFRLFYMHSSTDRHSLSDMNVIILWKMRGFFLDSLERCWRAKWSGSEETKSCVEMKIWDDKWTSSMCKHAVMLFERKIKSFGAYTMYARVV